MSSDGAGPNEQLLFAAKTDSAELLESILNGSRGDFDVNHRDGLGNTALHYAASAPSPTALELLLDYENTDVDLQNKLDLATPLHLAVKLSHEGARAGVVEMLIDAGADPRIKDRHGSTPASYLDPKTSEVDAEIVKQLRQAAHDLTFGGADAADIAGEGEEVGGSDSE